MASIFTELGNIDIAKRLVKMSYKTFREDITKECKDSQGEYKKMIKTCKQIIEGNGKVERKFEWKNGKQFGRKYTVGGGLQGLKKVVRGVLSQGLTTDVDIKMCYQMILLKICQDRKIKCSKLIHYINNREKVLEDMYSTDGLSRDDAKNTFHICINKKQLVKNVSNEFFKSFDVEMKKIMNTLWEMSDLEWMKEYADTEKGNVKGSFMSNLLQKFEDEIITACIPVLSENNLEICTLCFDGFLLKGVHYQNKFVLEKLKEVTDSLGYEIEWDFKEHTLFEIAEPQEDNEALTETDLADIFVDDYKNILFIGDSSAYKVNEFGIYTLITQPKELIRRILKDEYSQFSYLKKDAHLNSVANIIKTSLYTQDLEERFDLQFHLIPFQNGVYNLKENTFRCAHINEFVSKTLDYEYKKVDFDDIECLIKSLFEDDAQEYVMWKLGAILSGENKTFTVLHGGGNNGKTKVFVELINRAIGSFYNSVNKPMVTANKYDDASEKPQPEKLYFKNSIINVVNELPKGTIMCSSKIKEYTGGNVMKARKLHSNKQEEFRCRGQLYIDTNTLGTFDEVDQPLRERLQVLHFPYRFIAKDHSEYNPKNPYHKLLIPNVLDKYENTNVKMMNLMLHYHYKCAPEMPKSVELARKYLIGSIDDVEQFLQICTIGSGNSEGKELWREYKDNGGELKQPQFKERMKDKGYEYKKVSIFGSKVYGYNGVRFGVNDNSEDPE
jgi:phage/plasmid-associated DNA primase